MLLIFSPRNTKREALRTDQQRRYGPLTGDAAMSLAVALLPVVIERQMPAVDTVSAVRNGLWGIAGAGCATFKTLAQSHAGGTLAHIPIRHIPD
jgi:chaperone required for assembly of F1-ATPase